MSVFCADLPEIIGSNHDVGINAPKNTLYYRARSLTEVFMGYRVSGDSGTHFGWMKFARSDTWTRYPSGAVAAEVALDDNEAHRYFRLRQP